MILSLSANGDRSGSGILWASSTATVDAFQGTRSGILRALDAEDVSREIWNSRKCPLRDDLGFFAKFTPPTVANRKVYMAAFPRPPRNTENPLDQKDIAARWGSLIVYGLMDNSTSGSSCLPSRQMLFD
jgi:hypothetical protein